MTTIINDIPVTKYPLLPGYSTTISKVQGQTLVKAIIWLNTDITPHGTAYVALSRVCHLPDYDFLQPFRPPQLTPVCV